MGRGSCIPRSWRGSISDRLAGRGPGAGPRLLPSRIRSPGSSLSSTCRPSPGTWPSSSRSGYLSARCSMLYRDLLEPHAHRGARLRRLRGKPRPRGQKSVAFGFTFQGEKTLTDEEVDAEVGRIVGQARGRVRRARQELVAPACHSSFRMLIRIASWKPEFRFDGLAEAPLHHEAQFLVGGDGLAR